MRVLIAVDSTGTSQYVIAEAAARPWRSGTVLCVQSIVDMWYWNGAPELIEEAKHQARVLVKAAVDELSKSGHQVVSEIQAGVPKKDIPAYAKEWGADLIMVGSRRLDAVKRFFLGSVSHAVLRTAHCSVEIVRPSPRKVPASSPGMKILVGTDGSYFSEKAICAVATRPWPAESMIRVVSVREPVVPMTMTYEACYPPELINEILEQERRRAEDALASAQQMLKPAGLRLCEASATLLGDPRAILMEQAQSWGADLVVLGSHGRRGFDRVLLGSVSEAVATHAHCSVEVIRNEGEENHEPQTDTY